MAKPLARPVSNSDTTEERYRPNLCGCSQFTRRHSTYVNTPATKRTPNPISDLVPFDEWLASLGRSKASGWRYRKQNLIPTANLMGRIFVSRAAIAEFERRALAGEFAKPQRAPNQTTQNHSDHGKTEVSS